MTQPGFPADGASVMTGSGPEDIATAVLERVKAWLLSLSFQRRRTGEAFSLSGVLTEWPDEAFESDAYPVACVIEAGDVRYDTASLGPSELYAVLPGPGSMDGMQAIKTNEASLSVQIDIWCRDRSERRDVRRYLEQHAFSDVPGGHLLTMNRYHEQVVRVDITRSRSWQDELSQGAREHRLTVWADCSAPVIRVMTKPEADLRQAPASVVGFSPV